MAIKYLDAKRLQGTNAERLAMTTEASPTYTPTLSSDSGWAETGGSTYHDIDTVAEAIDFRNQRNVAGDRCISYDLGATVSDTAWVCRFKLVISDIEAISSNGQMETISLNSTPASTTFQSSQDYIGFNIGWWSSQADETDFNCSHANGASSQSNLSEIGTNMLAENTWYVELKRLTDESMSCSVSLNSDYTTGATTQTQTNVSASTEDLQYFTMKSNNGSTVSDSWVEGTVSEIKIWNSVTSIDAYPSLPNGTIFNETDTYKYFMFDGTDTWNQMVSS